MFIVWAFIEVFLVHKAGTVRPNSHWLSFKGTGAGSFSAAMVIAVASIAGWDGGIYVNEETERPERNPGLGAVIAVAILGVIFVSMFATFQGIAPLNALNKPCRERGGVRRPASRRHRRRPHHLDRGRAVGARDDAGRDHRHLAIDLLDVARPRACPRVSGASTRASTNTPAFSLRRPCSAAS